MSDFDLDAVVAEAEPRAPWTFTFGGEEYAMPGTPDAIAFLMLTKDETAADGFARLLGPDQWARMKASPSLLDGPAFRKLIDAYVSAAGNTTVGESSASATS